MERKAWATAFAMQAESDWKVFKLLSANKDLDRCHALHYLQMATEKIAKAYRYRDTSDEPAGHVVFAKFINGFLLSPVIKSKYKDRDAHLHELRKNARNLAREIEKLAPAVDRTSSPQNAEYPWSQGDDVIAPCQYGYPSLSLLQEPGGRAFLKLVEQLIQDFGGSEPEGD